MTISILLADDHTIIRDGLRFLLNAQPDIEVIGDAPNGRDAIREAVALRPNVVIMDIAMPELNGIDAAAQLREASPTSAVIILSVYSYTEHIYRALRAGARGYLLKESAGSEVVEAVRVVHSGHRYLSKKIADLVVEDYLIQRDLTGSPLERLTLREREILQLVVEGKTSTDIGAILTLSPKTVETYRSRLMEKLQLSDLPSLVKFAIQHGLTPPE